MHLHSHHSTSLHTIKKLLYERCDSRLIVYCSYNPAILIAKSSKGDKRIEDPNGMLSAGVVLVTVLLAMLMLPFVAFCLLRQQKLKAAFKDVVAAAPAADLSLHDTDAKDFGNQYENNATEIVSSMTRNAGNGRAQLAVQDNAANVFSTREKQSGNNNWRCACEGGFLPPNMFGNMESVVRMGGGQCYHKIR